MFWIIIGIVLFVLFAIAVGNKQDEVNTKLTQKGYLVISKVDSGKYIAGHPDINSPVARTAIYSRDKYLEIVIDNVAEMPRPKGKIKRNAVKNILVEDQSTIERRVTVGRLLLTGVFAFAWKKKHKNELAYLTIEWNDGRFDHETIFEFEGNGSIQKANTARNSLIKMVRYAKPDDVTEKPDDDDFYNHKTGDIL